MKMWARWEDQRFRVKKKGKRLLSVDDQPILALSMLLKTLVAVDWPTFGRFERNFAFLAAIGASSLVHLSWTAESTSFETHSLFTPFLASYTSDLTRK